MMNRRIAVILLSLVVVTTICSAQTAAERPFPRPGAPPLLVAGQRVEVIVVPVTARTVRISVCPLDWSAVVRPAPDDPAIVPRQWSAPLVKIRSTVPLVSSKSGALI